MTTFEAALYWFIFANLVGFVLMLWDKHRAETGGWRTPESTLILWSFIGGSIGTLAAQRIVRHKTRKQPIATILMVMPVLHVVAAILWFSGLLPDAFATRA